MIWWATTLWVWSMISLSLFIMFHTDIPVIGNLWLCGNWMVLGVLSCMLLIHLDRRWRARLPDTFQSLVMRFLACVTLGPVIFVELFAISMSLWPAALQGNGLDTMLWFKMWVLSIMQVGTWAMLYFLIESRILRAQAQRTAAEAREQWTQMALQTLHQQLHPHFLFPPPTPPHSTSMYGKQNSPDHFKRPNSPQSQQPNDPSLH